ncbi:hypothetical protein J656_0968 [Acinetobacter baumannii 755829]|nr:hypothetical protein J656_0968 [Acinetobacter baumannii 755829]
MNMDIYSATPPVAKKRRTYSKHPANTALPSGPISLNLVPA